MTFESEIKKVLKDGQITIGEKGVKKALLNGKAKMVIVSCSAAAEMKDDFRRYASLSKIPYYEFPDSPKELGYMCAKPFPITSMVVLDVGGSSILKLK